MVLLGKGHDVTAGSVRAALRDSAPVGVAEADVKPRNRKTVGASAELPPVLAALVPVFVVAQQHAPDPARSGAGRALASRLLVRPPA